MSLLRRAALGGLLATALLPASATAAPPSSCPKQGPDTTGLIGSTQVVTGTFSQAMQGSYVMVPFDVPSGTTQVRVRYCWSNPSGASNTLDLGIYQPRVSGDTVWGPHEFRGWGGSSHPDVAISPQGFSTSAQYLSAPKGYVPGRTTRGFDPGPIPSGKWAVELGVAAVSPPPATPSAGVDWRVEIDLSNDPSFATTPYSKAPYDSAPAKSAAGWYAGDFHVHGEHSSLGDATMKNIFDYGFKPKASGGAGLDFISLTDYVTNSAWGEIGRYQPDYPGKLIIPSTEVITYHGHAGNQASGVDPNREVADYRTGPIYEMTGPNAYGQVRAARPPSTIFDTVHADGGFTVVNHPRIYPPSVPGFAASCRGCYWGYSDADTDFSKVDAIELFNSAEILTPDPKVDTNAPNPFNADAITYWQHAMSLGHHIAAVSGSDDHHGDFTEGSASKPGIGSAYVGAPATMVYAPTLSVAGIEQGVKAGHTYVKPLGVGGPDLSLTAAQAGSSAPPAMMGDSITGNAVQITASTSNATTGKGQTLEIRRDNAIVASALLTGPSRTLTIPANVSGRYNVVVERTSKVIEALSSPIYVTATAPPPPVTQPPPSASHRPALRLRYTALTDRLIRNIRHLRFRFRLYDNRQRLHHVVIFVRRGGTRGRYHGKSPAFGITRKRHVSVHLRRGQRLRRGGYVAILLAHDARGRLVRVVTPFRLR